MTVRPRVPLPTYRDLLPEGIDVVRPLVAVKDEVERFYVTRRLDDGQTLVEVVEFTWTPFSKVVSRRVGLFRHEAYRTFDYDAIDRHRTALGTAAIAHLLSKEKPDA